MILRGINFGHVFNASGARNFFGEGYWFHKYLEPLGLRYTGSTFVAKTTTLHARLNPAAGQGNMPMRDDGVTPVEWRPKCIVVRLREGVVLNAVGLSGPGAHKLLARGAWQARTKPFLLSFMSVETTSVERASELDEFVALLKSRLTDFRAPIGLQINVSCPNVGLAAFELIKEVHYILEIAGRLNIPLIPKINALILPEAAREIMEHPNCDAICCSNTIPWDKVAENIRLRAFGTQTSPLAAFGGGGVSGKPLLPLVRGWIQTVRGLGCPKPIIGGGGILSFADAKTLLEAGASAVELGSISLLRPWRIRHLIKRVNRLMENKSIVSNLLL